MTVTLDNRLNERLDRVVDRLIEDDFLQGRGLGNEIGFYIFDYPPEQELVVRERIQLILREVPRKRPTLRVVHLDLFDLVIDYLRERNLLDKAIEMQQKRGDAVMLSKLSAPLQAEKLAIAFEKRIDLAQTDIVLLSGVGSVYPMLRSHSLLNNLHRVMGDKPLVMFFPGGYDGQSLSLFNKLPAENYYRAFKLIP
jgi:hypothetical protein